MKSLYIVLLALFLVGCPDIDRNVGAACDNDRDCNDRCLEDWPGGFCTLDCSDDRDCPTDAVCSDTRGGVCLLLCERDSECRDMLGDNDYECADRRNVDRGRDDVCVPD